MRIKPIFTDRFYEHEGLRSAWRPMDEWDNRDDLVFLLVDYREGGEHPLEDASVGFTIGHNHDHNTPGEGVGWQFAGWCWSHDHYTEGRGKPIAWKPIPAGLLKHGGTDD